MIFQYWFMFPLAILIATLAMTMGVGGALFFSPVFIILFPILGVETLSPAEAIGAALITELFGFASGFYGYFKRRLIDFKTGKKLVQVAMPLAIIGALAKHFIPDIIVLIIFSIGLLAMGVYTIRTNPHQDDQFFTRNESGPLRTLIDSEGEEYSYEVCNIPSGMALVATGGLFSGLISVGIGETTVSTLRARCGLPMKIASATSVFVVTIVVLTAAVVDVITIGIEAFPWDLLFFTVPGVIIGGQLGPNIANNVPENYAEKFLIFMFFLLSLVMGYVTLLKF